MPPPSPTPHIHAEESALASADELRVQSEVFRGYNSYVPPVRQESNNSLIEIAMDLQLILIIDVSERDQILHSNVWQVLTWHDFQMVWDRVQFGGVWKTCVSPDRVWLPDVVLYNNADGNYEVSYYSNVVITNDGTMLWVPPAIYKSSCIIDVEFFPFDEQLCHLIFGSWTYKSHEVQMSIGQRSGIDLTDYGFSNIWDLHDVPAILINHKASIDFMLIIRRKALFFTVVLIVPMVLTVFLNVSVFYLPCDSGEKMTLIIMTLMSIAVFLLLIAKILPPSATSIPLIAKYIIITLVLNMFTIFVTVLVLNVYFRAATTHQLPDWARFLMLVVAPRLFCMRRPKVTPLGKVRQSGTAATEEPAVKQTKMKRKTGVDLDELLSPLAQTEKHHAKCGRSPTPNRAAGGRGEMDDFYPLTADARRAVDAIEYITEHLKKDEEYRIIREDWKYISMIIDRLLLYTYLGVTIGSTFATLLSAPNVFESFDQAARKDFLQAKYLRPS